MYANGSRVEEAFCTICGSSFYRKCEKCGEPLEDLYYSSVYFTSGEPTQSVPRPGACKNCGNVFPWTIAERRERGAGNPKDVDEALVVVRRICNRFHEFVVQSRFRHDQRDGIEIVDEYDVQDYIRALLAINFDDIRTEEWTPSYAGGSARMDFVLKATTS